MSGSSEACRIEVYRSGDQLFLALSGWLRMQVCDSVRGRVQSLMQPEIKRVYLSLAQLHEIDSAGLGLLVGLHMHSRKAGVEFALVSPTPHHMKLLESTRLTTIMRIVTGLEAEEIRHRLLLPGLLVGDPWETIT